MAVTEWFIPASDSRAERLGAVLGIENPALARVLASFGLDATCAPLVAWIPAIEFAWRRSPTGDDRQRILALVFARHGLLATRAEILLYEWLARRPPAALFSTARRVLRAQLAMLPPDQRPALCAGVIAPCVQLAERSRGLLGLGPVSDDQQRWLRVLAEDLLFPNEQPDPRESLS